MKDPVESLTSILLNKTAELGERDDAAMELAEYPMDDIALNALIAVASNPFEADFIQYSCGESIAEIMLKRNGFKKNILEHLTPSAYGAAYLYLKAQKPDWLEDGAR